MAVAFVGVLIAMFALAAPASAATVSGGRLTITPLSNGALRLNYNGHSYTCYQGDLCLYRGGYQTYYVCQGVTNSVTSEGFSVNNQGGSGSTAKFIGRNGAANWNQAAGTAYYIHWNYVKSFTTCT
ncbi:MAG: hypothetical protein ACR2N4_15210 [Jatrophihabitans sp.]